MCIFLCTFQWNIIILIFSYKQNYFSRSDSFFFSTFLFPSFQVYLVDTNSMYLIPLLLVVAVCCFAIYSLTHDSRNRIVAILKLPVVGPHRRTIKPFFILFLLFVFVWCVWSVPLWIHSWERMQRPEARSQQQFHARQFNT